MRLRHDCIKGNTPKRERRRTAPQLNNTLTTMHTGLKFTLNSALQLYNSAAPATGSTAPATGSAAPATGSAATVATGALGGRELRGVCGVVLCGVDGRRGLTMSAMVSSGIFQHSRSLNACRLILPSELGSA